MKLHLNAITDSQRQIMVQLATFAQSRALYLGGGTAVALHFGHRRSVDLDWFTQQPIADPMQLAQEVRNTGIELEVNTVDRGTLHGTIRGVRVSFLEYRYPLLQPLEGGPEGKVPVAAAVDLASMKLLAVAQRGTKKDFIDVYALGVTELTLADMLQAYARKFSVDDTGRVLYSLSYFDDAEHEPIPHMLWDITWADVKKVIQGWIRDLVSEGGPRN